MPGIVPTRKARVYDHASDFPEEVWDALLQNEAAANIILPFAKKASTLPRGGDNDQLWIALYGETNNVEFVLSCTKGPLGNYPIFIVASKSSPQIAQEEEGGRDIAGSLEMLVTCLLKEVPPQRVFSVFSIASVAEKFAEIFVACTPQEYGVRAVKNPYYDATFTFCTSETFNETLDLTFRPLTTEPENIAINLRRAKLSCDLKGVAVLCKEFSATSPPYVLDNAGAELEARTMIESQQAWVHMVQKDGQEPEIACLVATTRESDNVTAVTKVFTPEHWRGRGCAKRLLHRVCQDVFRKERCVVLYVGRSEELASARKVYNKIGFQGLQVDGSQCQQVEGVDRWVEIGFEGTKLGYW